MAAHYPIPENFKGGAIWKVIVEIHSALQAIGLALLVLRTCGDFAQVKKPEYTLKLFIRFALAKGAVTYGLELMMALFQIVQGVISAIMKAAGFGTAQKMVLPQEIVTAVEDCGFFESIPLWAVTLVGGLFKLHLYTAIAPVPLSSFAGEPSQKWGVQIAFADCQNQYRRYCSYQRKNSKKSWEIGQNVRQSGNRQ